MKKILIADDDPKMIEIITLALQASDAGWEILTAPDGRSALALAIEHLPDLLILDLMMPNGHGYWVCSEVRADRSLDSMPILVLSAKQYPKDRADILSLGANAFLPKPFSLEQIVRQSRLLMDKAPAE